MSDSWYVTTPIYYMNGEPHIGHTYTTVVADTLARYHRLCGEDVFFLTGSDEHGEKVLEAAEAQHKTPLEVADHYSAIFRGTWQTLSITHDRFIRTTDADHTRAVQSVLQKVYDAGQIYFQEYEGNYCVGCERFLAERDTLDGVCRDHERPPEKRSESNYFFRMTDHFAWLEELLSERSDLVRPERYRNEVLGMLREDSGLGDLCISRPKSRLEWGVELPFDTDYICYVWFDALINYLTGIGYPDGPDFERRWASVEHVIGKDILKPHAVFWPIMLRAIGLETPQHVNVHGFWNVDDRKVAKSLGNMISPLAMREKYGFDAFRYFLLRETAFGLDSNFSEEAMIARLNADLANNLGNLVSRTLNMTGRYAAGQVPEPEPATDLEQAVEDAAAEAVSAVDIHLRAMEPHRALEAIFRVVDAANRYLEQREPWQAVKDPAREGEVRTALYTSCEALRIIAILLSPFLPEKCDEILARLGLGAAAGIGELSEATRWGGIEVGSATTKGKPLFPRIDVSEPGGEPS